MNKPFTNAHAHIFTAKHAPDYFLKTVIRNTALAVWVDAFLQKRQTRDILSVINKLYFWRSPSKREAVERYIQFVQVGTSSKQEDIFEKLDKTYRKYGDHRIIVLSQVLDFLDLERNSNHKNIFTQVEEIVSIKRNAAYQKSICPFLGVDPRIKGVNLLEWVKKYIHPDYGFCGIKIYPATGFYPFDIRLDDLWKWAEENQIPIMTHCTRVGSFYLGRMESLLNAGGLDVNAAESTHPRMVSIKNRVSNVMSDSTIRKKNMIWCNVFGHPENYIPVLDRYPYLKLCFAHLGGATEILHYYNLPNKRETYPPYLQDNWYDHVLDLLKKYPNVYSDISYTLSSKEALAEIGKEFRKDDTPGFPQEKRIINKLLYGTDYYMTQQEETGDEPNLQKMFLGNFTEEEALLLAYINPSRYLDSKLFPEH
jgi:predicted TIM-barrel fold metal-dependent hydrolase